MFPGTFNPKTGNLTAVVDGVVYNVDKQHKNYQPIMKAYKAGNKEDFLDYYSNNKNLEKIVQEKCLENTVGIKLVGDKLYYKDREVHHSYVNRIVEARKAGFPIEPMVNFFENLLQNPSARSIEELPDFLLNRNLPLTEDGCFLGYKTVSSNYYSKTAGTLELVSGKTDSTGHIYNGVGEVIECARRDVDDERSNECSYGLHVGGLQYAGPGGTFHGYNDKVVIVKVNPRDVVSVPKDYNAQKLRACKYEVISEYTQPLNDHYEGVEAGEKFDEKSILPNVTLDNLNTTDIVTFMYKGKNDSQARRRYCVVDAVEDDYFYGILTQDDSNYVCGDEVRKFLKSGVTDLEEYEIGEYDYDDDYDDDEDCDCWDNDCGCY